jgi:hypothetical protein
MGTRQEKKAPANRATAGMGGLPSFAGAQANGEVAPKADIHSTKTAWTATGY